MTGSDRAEREREEGRGLFASCISMFCTLYLRLDSQNGLKTDRNLTEKDFFLELFSVLSSTVLCHFKDVLLQPEGRFTRADVLLGRGLGKELPQTDRAVLSTAGQQELPICIYQRERETTT